MNLRWLATILITFPITAFAWGGKGHHTICSAATHLVKEPGLKLFLKARSHTMGHLCNVPDIHWKTLGSEVNKVGSPTHWIDPEILGLKLNEIPTNYQGLVNQFQGKDNKFSPGQKIESVPKELGSIWWRADQFHRLAIAAGQSAKKAKIPKTNDEAHDKDLPFNRAVYEFVVYSGLMGHFVGDAGQPYHTTTDYDGYRAGHGGIHEHYEESVVTPQDEHLESQIVSAARLLRKEKFLTAKNTIEKMREITILSHADIPYVLKLDTLIKPSAVDGKKRTPALRPDAEKEHLKYRELLVRHMSRSAALLAQLWDEAYRQSGRPKLESYRSYRYPFTPDFVAPDYYQESTAAKM